MDKSRAKRENHDKIRMSLIALVAIFSVSICVLGSIIGYKIYTKQSFEQKIESLKKETVSYTHLTLPTNREV